MLKIQVLDDPEFSTSFTSWLKQLQGIEVVQSHPDVVFDFAFLNPERKLAQLSQLHLTGTVLITNALTLSATTIAQALPPGIPIAGVPMFPSYFERQKLVEFMLPYGSTMPATKIKDILSAIGKESEQIEDAVAGVFPRSLSMIINEAAFAVQEGVATVEDIDTAMKLGTNYPKGPLAWCDEIGAKSVVATLDALAREYGQERYKVATRLRRMAETGATFYAITI